MRWGVGQDAMDSDYHISIVLFNHDTVKGFGCGVLAMWWLTIDFLTRLTFG